MSHINILRSLLTSAAISIATAMPLILSANVNAADPIPLAGETNQVDLIATVISVDLPSRVVVLKSDEGKQSSVKVGDAVQRLNEIQPGDRIKIRYFESTTLELRQHPKGQPVSVTEASERAPSGKSPSGQVARQIRGTLEVSAIDLQKNTITLKGPTGAEQTVTVKKPSNQAALKKLKKGDLIDITYTEAMAAEVIKQ